MARSGFGEALTNQAYVLETLNSMREVNLIAVEVSIRALDSPVQEVRLQAIATLTNLAAPAQAVMTALAKRLKDESALVRAAAAHALGNMGTPARAAAAALSSLLEDKDEGVRASAAEALHLVQSNRVDVIGGRQ
jgi:HEAT repeat protein